MNGNLKPNLNLTPQPFGIENGEYYSLRYPVLYVLDGKYSFGLMSSIRDLMDLGKEIKDIIIVSIDDSISMDADWMASRYYDFTPVI